MRYRNEDGKKRKATYDAENQVFKDKSGNVVTGNAFVDDVTESLKYSSKGDKHGIINSVAADKRKVTIRKSNGKTKFGIGRFGKKTIDFNPKKGLKTVDLAFTGGTVDSPLFDRKENGGRQTPALGLFH